jgi:hypothetical protein
MDTFSCFLKLREMTTYVDLLSFCRVSSRKITLVELLDKS